MSGKISTLWSPTLALPTFGGQHWVLVAVALTAVIAAYTDIRYRKIYNALTLPAMIAGFCFWTYLSGWNGFFYALGGTSLGVMLVVWIYFLKHMGAGDVKLLMALGAWIGPVATLETALLSIALGAILGVAQILVLRRGRETISRLKQLYLKIAAPELGLDAPSIDRSLKMPFGVSIGLAAVSTLVFDPFNYLGVRLW